MKSETFTTWAIDTRSDEGHGLIGRYWSFTETYPIIPANLEGCEISLFKTRKIARENLPPVRQYSFPHAVPVKVKVTIKRDSSDG